MHAIMTIKISLMDEEMSYWVPQNLPQIYTVIAYIFTGKVAWFSV